MKSFVLATGLAAIAFADGHATATNSTEAADSDPINIDVHSDDDALQMLLDLVAEFCSHEESDHDMDHHDMDHHDDMDHDDMVAHEDQGMMAEGEMMAEGDMMAEGEMTFNTEEHHDMDGDAISGHDSDHDGSDSDHDGSDSDSDDDHHDVADRWMCRHAMKMLHEYTEYHNSDEEGKRHRAGEWGHDMAEAAHQMGWLDGATGMVTYGTAVVAAVATLFF